MRFRRLGIIRRKYFTALGFVNRLWFFLRAVVRLVSVIRRRRIDVVYSNTSNVVAGALAVAGWAVGCSLVSIPMLRARPELADRRILRAASYRARRTTCAASASGPRATASR